MKVSKETIQALSNLGYRVWGDLKGYEFLEDDQDYEKATHLVIGYYGEDDEWVKKFKAPKTKEVTIEWVIDKISKESSYINLYLMLSKRFNGINVYAASYGIGVCSLMNIEADIAFVRSKLDEYGIKYRTEYSVLVYRFIISKSKDNIRRLQEIK